MMVERGTWWVPTLALVPLSIERRKKDPAWSGQQLANEDDKDAAIHEALIYALARRWGLTWRMSA